MIIDSHLHVWQSDSPQYPWHPLAHVRPDYAWPVERTLEFMNLHKIFGGVLIQVSLYGFDNSYLIDCGKKYPDRFQLVGMLDPRSENIESEMETLAEAGVRGLRLAMDLRADIPWYNHPSADRLWRKAGELGMILTLLIDLSHIEDASKAIQRFPQVTVVIDHLARPDPSDDLDLYSFESLLQLARFEQVYVKSSALGYMSRLPYPHPDALEWVRQTYAAYGASRMMWGTDTPMSQDPNEIPAALKLIDLALPNISEQEHEDILGGTAWRLFGWA
jgi:predicted TIM-barrel fold metal-dependent hydrolase